MFPPTAILTYRLSLICSKILQFRDINEGLHYADNSFHFVHVRDMQSAEISWVNLVQEIRRILVPGGVVQFAEFDYRHRVHNDEMVLRYYRSPVARMQGRFIDVFPCSNLIFIIERY
jgi:ubiquinone/menaquinone biosynthesis C-methylase UbiE